MSDESWGQLGRVGQAGWRSLCGRLHAVPALEPLHRRRPRRWLVGAYLLVLAAFPAVGWATGQQWGVMLLLIPYAAGSVLLAAATGGVLDRPMGSLDERQRHLRRTLFREPYQTGAALGLVGGLVVAVALRAGEGVMLGLLLLVVGVVFGLPSMVLAWRLPDGIDDDG